MCETDSFFVQLDGSGGQSNRFYVKKENDDIMTKDSQEREMGKQDKSPHQRPTKLMLTGVGPSK